MSSSSVSPSAARPSGWKERTVGSLGSIFGGSTPSRDVARYWGGPVPWVTPTELTSLDTKYLAGTRETLTKAGLGRMRGEDSPG